MASETLGLRENFIDPQGLRGTRSHAASRSRAAGRLVTGDLSLEAPTATEWATILPYITGSAGVVSGGGKNYPLQETLPAFFTDILRGATLFRYSGCRVARATITARKGSAVGCNLSILGVDETLPGGAFPSLTLPNDQFFILEDSDNAVVVAGTTISCFDWTLVIDNMLQARMINSQTAQVVYTTDRICTMTFRLPWGDAESLYGLAQAGVAASITLTNGTTSLAITAPAFQVPRMSPDVRGRDEIINEVTGVCRWSSVANDEIGIFLDAA